MHALVSALCGPGLSVVQGAAVGTCGLVVGALLLQTAIGLHAALAPGYKRSAALPQASRATMLAADIACWACYFGPACLWDAWAQPAWSYSAPGLLATVYWSMAVLVLVDAWYYAVHRFCHSSRTAYRLLHAKHHEPTASLAAATAAYVEPACALLEGGAPIAVACALTAAITGNFWHALGGISLAATLVIYGHIGIDYSFDSPYDLLGALFCPLMGPYSMLPIAQTPMGHQHHHTHPRANYAPFFTWLDDLFQTLPDGRLPCSLLVLAMALGYQAAVLVTEYCLITRPALTAAAYLVAYLLVPAELPAAALSGRIPELVRSLFGWLQDAYRRHLAISYSAPGSLGAFTPVESSDGAPATYVFACHPTGVLSRGALLTFAARGWRSPVSGLARVRLAVGSVLFKLPIIFSREFLLAIGCVPAGKDSLRQQLQAGTSIAITPGGFREPTHTGSYKVLLRERTGFIALALETGAHLVPTLCLGEHTLATDWGCKPYERAYPTYAAWAKRLMFGTRPEPVHVVFGPPLTAKAGEDVHQLHQRYTARLQSLAADHGVKLELL